MSFHFHQIGIIHSCYKEKFAIPRQPGLVKHATASIELLAPYNHPDSLNGLEDFSHIWVSFIFHENIGKAFKHQVKPPRLNGVKKGVYATRSPYRPNPLGLSVVELKSIEINEKGCYLHLSGGDFLDQTPVIDIKPYIAYSDRIDKTQESYLPSLAEADFKVILSEVAEQKIQAIELRYPEIRLFIQELLSQDPRPYYTKKIKKAYSARVYDYDLHWVMDDNEVRVVDIMENTNRASNIS